VGGNAALALLLTVGTNLAGIFTMPFMLSAILGMGSAAVQLDPGPLLGSLLRSIAAPLLAGVAARALLPGALLLRDVFSPRPIA
jgi:sodium/bile acid cotransporter 7